MSILNGGSGSKYDVTRPILVRAGSIFLWVRYERCKIRIFVAITAVRSRVKPAAVPSKLENKMSPRSFRTVFRRVFLKNRSFRVYTKRRKTRIIFHYALWWRRLARYYYRCKWYVSWRTAVYCVFTTPRCVLFRDGKRENFERKAPKLSGSPSPWVKRIYP